MEVNRREYIPQSEDEIVLSALHKAVAEKRLSQDEAGSRFEAYKLGQKGLRLAGIGDESLGA